MPPPRQEKGHDWVRAPTALQQRIFRWMTALQAIAERRRFDREFTGFQYTTYGFVPASTTTAMFGGIQQPERLRVRHSR